jgi:hypothetical protein
MLRDQVLLASGRLDRRMFGPPIPVAEDTVGLVLPANDSPRRSVYLQVRRTRPVSLLTAFDAPVMTVNCERRLPSTTPSQSLMLMNSDFILDHAGLIAKRIRAGAPKAELASLIPAAWQAIYQRPISDEEQSWARDFTTHQLKGLDPSVAGGERDLFVLTSLCQQLLSSNEFLYVD